MIVDDHRKIAKEDSFLLFLLTLSAGSLGAYVYLLHGEVFSNAQTLNFLLAGVNAAGRNWDKTLYYFCPVLVHLITTFVSEYLILLFNKKFGLRFTTVFAVMASSISIIYSVIPCGVYDRIIQLVSSFVCSLQLSLFTHYNGISLTTIFCTNNLRYFASSCALALIKKDREALKRIMCYFTALLGFFTGAFLMSFLIKRTEEMSILLTAFSYFTIFVKLFIKDIKTIKEM